MAALKGVENAQKGEKKGEKRRHPRFVTNLRFYSDPIWLSSIRHPFLIFMVFEDDRLF